MGSLTQPLSMGTTLAWHLDMPAYMRRTRQQMLGRKASPAGFGPTADVG